MNGTRNETILAQERLHAAVFVVPAFVGLVTALPTFFVLLMIHVFTTMFTNLIAQFSHQQITLFDGYFYIFASLPTIFATVPVLLATLVAYWKSTITLTNRRLTYRTGLVSIVKGELPLENVDAIITEDPLLGRLFGFGTVIVTSVGGLRLPFYYLHSPGHFYQILNKAVNRAKTSSEEPPEPVGKGETAFSPKNENDDARYMPKGYGSAMTLLRARLRRAGCHGC